MVEREEMVEDRVEVVEVPETWEEQVREAFQTARRGQVERSSSSVKEPWMERVGELYPHGALRGQRQAASLEVGLEVGR
jgi:hypothetical protein